MSGIFDGGEDGGFGDSGDGSEAEGYVAAGKAVLKMLPDGFFENTFGAIFANGLRLDCWGTSNSPSKSKGEATQDSQDLYQRAGLEQGISAANVNKFAEYMQIYIAARTYGESRSNRSDCTRDGNTTGKEFMQSFYDQTLSEIRNTLKSKGYTLKSTGTRTIPKSSITMKVKSGYNNGYMDPTRFDKDVTVPVFTIEGLGNGQVGNDNNTNGGSGVIGNSNTTNQAGMGLLLPVGIAAIGIPYLAKKMKGQDFTQLPKKIIPKKSSK